MANDDGNTDDGAAELSGAANSFGRFTIVGRLGSGAAGEVLKAWDPKRDCYVAIKRPLVSRMSAEGLERFLREGRIGQELEHPNIVRVYESGTVDGIPYIASEFIEGRALSEVPVVGKLGLQGAALLIAKIARALHYAHEKKVIHRDLKPANILLDGKGEPHITDFGAALWKDAESTLTEPGDQVGTRRYMPPEQIAGHSHLVDGRSDLYSLGVILYELLTGKLPFPDKQVGLTEAVCYSDPPPFCESGATIDRGLETICMTCLEKDRRDRYPSCRHLAVALKRWSKGKPLCPPPSSRLARYRRRVVRKLMAPKVRVLWAAPALVLALAASLAMVLFFGPGRGDVERVPVPDPTAEEKVAKEEYRGLLNDAIRAFDERRLSDLEGLVTGSPPGQVGWETRYLDYQSLSERPYVAAAYAEHAFGALDALLDPDGKRMITAGSDGMVAVWDLASGKVLRRLVEPRFHAGARRYLHFMEGWPEDTPWPPATPCFADLCWVKPGSRVAGASLDGTGCWIDVASGRQAVLVKGRDPLNAVAANGDGTQVLFGAESGTLSLCAVEGASSPVAKAACPASVAAIAWWPRGLWVVGCRDGKVRVLDGKTLAPVTEQAVPPPVWSLDLVARGEEGLLAVGCGQPRVSAYRLARNPPQFALDNAVDLPQGKRPAKAVHSVRFHEDGRLVYLINDAARIALWDRSAQRLRWIGPERFESESTMSRLRQEAAQRRWPFPFALERIAAVAAVTGDGQRVATVAQMPTVCLWALGPPGLPTSLQARPFSRIAFDREQTHVLWALAKDGALEAIDSVRGARLDAKRAHPAGANALAAAGDPSTVFTAGEDGFVRSWRVSAAGKIEQGPYQRRHGQPLCGVAVSHHGRWLAAVDAQATLVVWELDAYKPVFQEALSDPPERPLTGRVAFNADDTRLAAFGARHLSGVFSTQPWQRLRENLVLAGAGSSWAKAGESRSAILAISADCGSSPPGRERDTTWTWTPGVAAWLSRMRTEGSTFVRPRRRNLSPKRSPPRNARLGRGRPCWKTDRNLGPPIRTWLSRTPRATSRLPSFEKRTAGTNSRWSPSAPASPQEEHWKPSSRMESPIPAVSNSSSRRVGRRRPSTAITRPPSRSGIVSVFGSPAAPKPASGRGKISSKKVTSACTRRRRCATD